MPMGGGGMNQYGLGIVFQARDMASGVMGAMSSSFGGLRNRIAAGAPAIIGALGAIAAGVAALAVGLGALSTAFNFARIAGRFEQNMAAIGAVTRATEQQLRALEASAIQAGIATQFSPREAAEGLQSLATAGQNAEQAMATLNPVLDLAAGSLGQLGVAEAAQAVVGTLNSYRLSAEDAVSVTDRLLRITQLSNFQARDFQVGLARAAATAAQYGTSLDDVLITMGMLRNANIEASVASTANREAMRRVMTDQRALRELQQLGVRSYDEATGSARSSLTIMQEVADATRSMTDEDRNAIATRIFGVRGLLAFNAVYQAQVEVMRDGERVVLRGADAIAHLRNEMSSAEGTAESFRQRVLATFQGQMVLLQGTIETLKTTIGLTFAKLLRPVVLAVTETLNAFIRIWMSIPESGRLLIGAMTMIGAVFLVFSGVVLTVVGALTLLVVVAAEVLIAVGIAAAAIAAFGILIAAWGASIAGISYIIYRAWQQNMGGLADWVNEWGKRISLVWRSLTELFTQGGFSEGVMRELDAAGNQGVRRFVLELWGLWQRVQAFWRGFVEAIGNMWKASRPYWQELVGALEELGKAFNELFGPAGDIIKNANNLPTSQYQAFGQQVGTSVGGGLSTAARGLTAFVQLMAWLVRIIAVAQPYFEALSDWAWGVYDAFVAVERVLARVGRAVTMIPDTVANLIGAAFGVEGSTEQLARNRAFVQQETETFLPARGGGRGVQMQQQRLQMAALRRAQAAQTEEVVATRTQGVGAQSGGAASVDRLATAVERMGNRGRSTMTTELTLDGEKLAQKVTEIIERNGMLEGRLVSQGAGG